MRESCLLRIPRQRLTMLRQEYLTICDGDKGAALLLAFFEHGHNFKLKMREKNIQANNVAEKHGDPRIQDEKLYQFYTMSQLQEGLLSVVGRPAIQKGIKILEDKKFISIHRNPIKRYHFDSTKHFLLHTKTVNSMLQKLSDVLTETVRPSNTNSETSSHKLSEQVLILPTKITKETTSFFPKNKNSELSEKTSNTNHKENLDDSKNPLFIQPRPVPISAADLPLSDNIIPSTNPNIPVSILTPLKPPLSSPQEGISPTTQTTISTNPKIDIGREVAEIFSAKRKLHYPAVSSPTEKEMKTWATIMGSITTAKNKHSVINAIEFALTESKGWKAGFITEPRTFKRNWPSLAILSQNKKDKEDDMVGIYPE